MSILNRKKYKDYECPWPGCREKFTAHAPGQVGEDKKRVGTQVKCPGCQNYIKN